MKTDGPATILCGQCRRVLKAPLSEERARALYVEYQAGLSLEEVGAKHGVSWYQVFSAFRRHGLARRTRNDGNRKPRVALEIVRQMHRDYERPMSLAAVGRKYKRHRGSVRELFVKRGFAVRPCDFEMVRLPNGCIAPAAPLTEVEIDALIAKANKLAVPAELKREWRQWSMQKRGEFIARLRAKLNSPNDRPATPFSANVEPFDYTSQRARAIAGQVNAGKNSREAGCKVNVASQGVIYRGQLYFWVANTGYVMGIRWTPEFSRPILSRVIWEEHHGRPVPPEHVIRFADGNPNNFAPENLILRTRNDLVREAQATHLLKKSRTVTALLLQRAQGRKKHGHTKTIQSLKAA